ncbi:hypothetical protein [Pseudomonas aeruginosa]|uniref:hypothetical protein n=1 Tax=Pseudomonas aeruginosa TaxID=287 RepID=UPI0018E05B70|nr:hypothetical protein [Pseudomonas aeruginosa]QPZ63185.1 hypothetical protein I9X26_13225 [Pseudomonas aeruginosa]HBO3954671.1 hypothetical protein [Pseudomonas aeruginosa]
MLESQAKYIACNVEGLQAARGRFISVKPQAQERFYADMASKFGSRGCHNWYRTASGEVVNS